MNRFLFSSPFKKGLQAIVALTLLFFSLGPVGTRVVYAAPPVNDSINFATQINSLIFVDALNTTEATPTDVGTPGGIGGDPDNINCAGFPLNAGYASVWYKYTPSINESISLDTLGSNYDTFIAVWSGSIGSLNLVTCNDDTFENQQSELFFTGNAGTQYFIEIAQFSYYDDEPPRPPPAVKGGTLQFHAFITTTNVAIHGAIKGKYYIPPGGSLRRSFADIDDGPAQITSTNGALLIAGMRVIWKEPGLRFSYSELMGLPREQLSSEYWFPWYNNALQSTSMDQGLRIANIDPAAGNTVEVWVGNTKLDTITLTARGSVRVNYPVDNGPIKIVCTTCTNLGDDKILAAIRVIWKEPGVRTSYTEMMGLPKESLSTEYWFPWYNNAAPASMEQGFRIANVDLLSGNTVEIRVGNTLLDTINLGAGGSVRKNYAVDNGPIKIVCTTCTNTNYDQIITALRVIWKEPGYRSSYTEMMGLPKEKLSTEYWFPWYNNLTTTAMEQGFRIANVSTTEANTVQVSVGSTTLGTVFLAAGGSTRVTYGVDNGPIKIVCTTCTNTNYDQIITALRVIWKEPGYRTSYTEMMGLPVQQLSTEYWFPWYNNAVITSMEQGFRFGVP